MTPSPPSLRSARHALPATTAALTLALTLAGCSGGGGPATASGTTPSPAASSDTTPSPSSTSETTTPSAGGPASGTTAPSTPAPASGSATQGSGGGSTAGAGFVPEGADPARNGALPLSEGFLAALPEAAVTHRASSPTEDPLARALEGVELPGTPTTDVNVIASELQGLQTPGEGGAAMGGERPEGTLRLMLLCDDPDAGPSSVGILGADGFAAYQPLGWSDRCGGYVVMVPESDAEDLVVSAEVPEGTRYRLSVITDHDPVAN